MHFILSTNDKKCVDEIRIEYEVRKNTANSFFYLAKRAVFY